MNKYKNKPIITYMLIGINIVVYFLMFLSGGTEKIIEFGAKYSPLIVEGQYWRLFTPMFIHIGLQHLVINMVTLYFLGIQLETIFGKSRYLAIYIISGICGNIASFTFIFNNISAGSSTALFGLFGSFLMLGESFRNNLYLRTMSRQFLILVGLNLVFGMFGSVDIAGHIGGLLSGFFLGYAVGVPNNVGKIAKNKRIVAVITLIIIFGIILNLGFTK